MWECVCIYWESICVCEILKLWICRCWIWCLFRRRRIDYSSSILDVFWVNWMFLCLLVWLVCMFVFFFLYWVIFWCWCRLIVCLFFFMLSGWRSTRRVRRLVCETWVCCLWWVSFFNCCLWMSVVDCCWGWEVCGWFYCWWCVWWCSCEWKFCESCVCWFRVARVALWRCRYREWNLI